MTNIELQTMSAVKEAARAFVNNEIDWEQRRYEIAKAAMQGMLANNALSKTFYELAVNSIRCADVLIEQLKEIEDHGSK